MNTKRHGYHCERMKNGKENMFKEMNGTLNVMKF